MVEQVQLDRAEQGLSYYNLNQLPLHFSVALSPLRSLSAHSACSSLLLAISNPIFFRLLSLSLSSILPPLVYLSRLSLNIAHSPSLSHQLYPSATFLTRSLSLPHSVSLSLSLSLLMGCRVHCSDSCCYNHQLQPPQQPLLWRREHGNSASYHRPYLGYTVQDYYKVIMLSPSLCRYCAKSFTELYCQKNS